SRRPPRRGAVGGRAGRRRGCGPERQAPRPGRNRGRRPWLPGGPPTMSNPVNPPGADPGIMLASFDRLWPLLDRAADEGGLSGEVVRHLLAVSEHASAAGDWARAWRAWGLADRAAGNDLRLAAQVADQCGALHHRRGERPAAL